MKPYFFLFTWILPLAISAQNPQEIADGNNKFAFRLFHELQENPGQNLFYSSFSISTAMAMVYAGARTETALQISQAMNFQQGLNFHAGYKDLLNRLSKSAEGKIKLNIANGLWAQKDFTFLDSYFDVVRLNYNPELKNADFLDNIEREKVRKEINAWVEQKTYDKIKDLLSQGDLDSQTRLVLVNAIYFYGDWANPFEKIRTGTKDFFLTGNTQIKASFMNQQGGFNYYEDTEVQAIEMPYSDNKVSMVIFLPKTKDGISDFEKLFDHKYYQEIIAAFRNNRVWISLPKFQATFRINLETALSRMGMPLAFSPGGADFSGMTGRRDLYISKVVHQAFINVDEKGSEAAAATAVVMKVTAAPTKSKLFNADHPFIFCIKDNATGSILFMGRIMKP